MAFIKVKCGRCGGSGSDENKRDENGQIAPESCTMCGGSGYVVSGVIDLTAMEDDITKCLRRLKKIMDKLEIGD